MAEVCLRGVAIRLVKFTDKPHNWAVFEIGRVNTSERREFEPAFENLYDEDMELVGDDPTNGKLQWKKAADYTSLYTVRVCLFVKNMSLDSDPFGKTYDEADVTIEYHDGNVRPSLKKIISRGREGYHDGVSWFADNPVDWDAPEPLEKAFNINCAAIRLIEWIGDYAIVEIGRLSDDDVENLKKAFKGKDRYTLPTAHDPLDCKIEIETPIDGGEMMWKTARACFYIGSDVRGKFKLGDIRNDCRIEIWYTNSNIRPVIDEITGEPIEREELASCWFVKHPTEWDKEYNASHVDIPKKEEKPMKFFEDFRSVALSVEEMLGGDWWRVKIGRLSEDEVTKLRRLHTYVKPKSCPPWGDKTEGKLHVEKREGTEFYEAEVCLRIRTFEPETGIDHLNSGMIFDDVKFTLYWSSEPLEQRLVLKGFKNGTMTLGCIKAPDWFKEDEDDEVEEYTEDEDTEEEETCIKHEFRNVAVKVVSKSPRPRYLILELGRLTNMEIDWLEKMAKFKGIFHDDENRKWDTTNGTVISTYIDKLGYNAARICVYNYVGKSFDIGSTIDAANITIHANAANIRPSLMKMEPNPSASNTSSKDWFSKVGKWGEEDDGATDDNATYIRFGNVAIRLIKTLGTTQHAAPTSKYVIAEIGRLTKEEINALKETFDKCGRVITISDDETKGGVHAENATFLKDILAQRFYTARICLYIPDVETLNKLQACRIIDSANLTIKTFPGCIRPELSEVLNRTDAKNLNTANWFCRMGGYQGGYVYSVGGRGSGKTAAMRAAMNSAYGMAIPGGTNLDDAMAYCRADVITQESLWRAAIKKSKEEEDTMKRFGVPKIEEVIIDEPAVIVKWADGSKTVVKARDEEFDPEKGLAMAIARKALGNDRDYYVYMQRHLNKALKKTKKRAEAKKATPKTVAKKSSGSTKKNGGKKK